MKLIPHHVAITVNNLKESVTWYKDTLGFDLDHEYSNGNMEIAILVNGSCRLELFNFKKLIRFQNIEKVC